MSIVTFAAIYLFCAGSDGGAMVVDAAPELAESLVVAQSNISDLLKQRDSLISNNKLVEAAKVARRVVDLRRASGPAGVALGEDLRALGKLETLLKEFKEAEQDLSESLRFLKDAEGPETLRVASTYDALAALAKAQSDPAKGIEDCKIALSIRQKLDPNSMDTAATIAAMGVLSYYIDKLDDAEKFGSQALAIQHKLSPGSPQEADTLSELGIVADGQGHFADSRRLHEQSISIRKNISPNSMSLAYGYENLGAVAFEEGKPAEAKELILKALAIEQRLSPESSDIAELLNGLGSAAHDLGQLVEAQHFLEHARTIQEKLSPDSIALSDTLNSLAYVIEDRGRFDEAEVEYKRALGIRVKRAPNSYRVPESLQNLGVVACERGHLEEARARMEESLALFRKVSPGSLDEATALNNLGNVAEVQGRLDEAQTYYGQGLDLRNRISPDSMSVSVSLLNLASVANSRNQVELARAYLEKCLKLREKLAPNSIYLANALGSLGAVESSRWQLKEARVSVSRALKIEESVAPDSMAIATTWNQFGEISEKEKDYSSAQKYIERSIAIQERLEPVSLELAANLDLLFRVFLESGQEGRAFSLLLKRANVLSDFAARESVTGSEIPTLNHEIGILFDDIGQLTDSKRAALAYAILADLRGLALSLESRSRSLEMQADSDKALHEAIELRNETAKRESDWIQGRTAEIPESEFRKKLEDLRVESARAKSGVSRLLKAKYPKLVAEPKITAKQVRAELLSNTSLVEYVRVDSPFNKEKKGIESEYAAYIISKFSEPVFIRLGRANRIDSDVKDFAALLDSDDGTPALLHLSHKLYNELIKPLGQLSKNVLITPDGILNDLPFNALLDDRGKYILETTSLSMVGGGRELVERKTRGKPSAGAVFAAPAYDTDPAFQAQAVKRLNASIDRGTVLQRDISASKFEPLPGALAEGKLVAKALGLTPITGVDATEERLYTLKSPRVLHISTHGVFFAPIRDEQSARTTLMLSDNMAGRLRVADDPMLRSALAFAGANNADELRKRGLHDGWATAAEISQMDLAGTELVVLSGCDTGLGDYRVGEGVYGLQRAFRFAGAQTLIMSLFSVPDMATKRLMASFYKNWKPGMAAGSRLNALRGAQLNLLHNSKTRKPKNWAGFVLLGDR